MSEYGARSTVRVWDLLEPTDAARFAAGAGISTAALRDVPFPCRGVRIPADLIAGGTGPGEMFAPEGPVGEAGATVIPGEHATLLTGPARSLAAAAACIPDPLGTRISQALLSYQEPSTEIRFADGASLDLGHRVLVMGILNVTPDSFSDGGRFARFDDAVSAGLRMAEEGADVVDVGGESTRPGSDAIDLAEERARVVPVIERLRRERPTLRISVDTRKAEVARDALDAGAGMINDVSALADPAMASLAAQRGVPVALMHMRGEPRAMQHDTSYRDLLGEIAAFLEERVVDALAAGIPNDKILIDPGIGFGKSALGNEEILCQLGSLRTLGLPILVGASRKSFVGSRTGVSVPQNRLLGSVSAAVAAVLAGARAVRVHDVRETREALAMADAVRRWPGAHGES